jgi:hypothetical protein
MERTFETCGTIAGFFKSEYGVCIRILKMAISALMKSFIAIIANIERYDQKELTSRSTESAVRNIASK